MTRPEMFAVELATQIALAAGIGLCVSVVLACIAMLLAA